ncbi:MAG: IclR family KDG regulon transcriptional repressor [Cellvibrionaceae bacterium]|jgi:IclR family KDG regulon transcriptional repressor
MLRTIERTSQLLKLFTLETPEWGITELATRLGWSTSTTHDLASSLTRIGLLQKSGNRRYTLGRRVLELSQVVLGSSSLQMEARKGMEQFAAKHDETILLGVLAGGKVLFADKIFSKFFLPNVLSTPDMRFNAHCTAAGKVILSHLSAADLQNILNEHGLEPMTAQSIQSIVNLNQELEKIERQGYAYAFEESIIGLGCVAAPIFSHQGKVVAALSITRSIQHFERHLDEYRNAVVRTAKQVSKGLGYMIFTG